MLNVNITKVLEGLQKYQNHPGGAKRRLNNRFEVVQISFVDKFLNFFCLGKNKEVFTNSQELINCIANRVTATNLATIQDKTAFATARQGLIILRNTYLNDNGSLEDALAALEAASAATNMPANDAAPQKAPPPARAAACRKPIAPLNPRRAPIVPLNSRLQPASQAPTGIAPCPQPKAVPQQQTTTPVATTPPSKVLPATHSPRSSFGSPSSASVSPESTATPGVSPPPSAASGATDTQLFTDKNVLSISCDSDKRAILLSLKRHLNSSFDALDLTTTTVDVKITDTGCCVHSSAFRQAVSISSASLESGYPALHKILSTTSGHPTPGRLTPGIKA